MRRQFSFLALFVGLFIVLASVLLLDSVFANEKAATESNFITLLGESFSDDSLFLYSAKENNGQTEVVLPVIHSNFTFNGLGLKWQLEENSDWSFNLYVKTDKTDWQPVNLMTESGRDTSYIYSEPLFLSGTDIEVKIVSDKNISEINNPFRKLDLIYFNTQQAPMNFSNIYRKTAGNNSLSIISREEWGANEEYRFWDPQYSTPKAFVIHHTAGGDGSDDPAATVRGIYYWHAVVLGWGDIGYNYLVDPEGNIYEGRAGGDGVIGAHAYNNVDDINYNDGTVGISVLGCYENEANDCYQVNEYNDNIQKAVTDLIAVKSAAMNISLAGNRTLYGTEFPSVVGHQDLDYTLCPGNILEEQLPSIINVSLEKLSTLQQDYKGKLISHNFSPAYFINSQADITATYKNKGALSWSKDKVYLKVHNSATKENSIYYLSNDVLPGEEYNFNFLWQADDAYGEQRLTLRLFRNKKYIPGSRQFIQLRLDSPDQAVLKKHSLPVAMLDSWNPGVKIKYKNTGLTAWQSNNTELYVNGQKVSNLNESSVLSGENGTFNFNIQDIPDLTKGYNKLVILLKKDGKTAQYSRFVWTIRID
ncbi:MAG: N-acetylmuramoyl-L-alanine amidase [Patescibacteria group bacterium]